MLEGRSSIGRLGMSIHVTAGFGDIGFDGYWTLEITVTQPTIIYPDIEICQIYYHTIEGSYNLYTSGKYNENSGIQPSLMYKDFEKQNPTTKYKVGNKVLVKKDLSISRIYSMEDNPTHSKAISFEMINKFSGSVVTICEITNEGYYIKEDAGTSIWTDDMFVRRIEL